MSKNKIEESQDVAEISLAILRRMPKGATVQLEVDVVRRLLEDLLASRAEPVRKGAAALGLPSARDLVAQHRGEMSVAEASKILGISRQAVGDRIRSGTLLARQVGRAYLVDAESVRTAGTLRSRVNDKVGRAKRRAKAIEQDCTP